MAGSFPGKAAAMATITQETDIDAPAETVWALLEDVRRLPEFSPSTVSVDDAPPVLDRPGQTYTQVGCLFGKRYRSKWTVEEIDPGRRIRSRGALGPGVSYTLTQALMPTNDGCHLSIKIDYRLPLGPLGRLASKLGVAGRASTEAAEVIAGLKRVAENSAAVDPSPAGG
ncbi:MAG: hypothetical protein NVSMB16_02100 [Acidimicrobiales bacterium]